jgi:hypothetical protein
MGSTGWCGLNSIHYVVVCKLAVYTPLGSTGYFKMPGLGPPIDWSTDDKP